MIPQRAFETKLRTARERATEKSFLEEMHRSLLGGAKAVSAKQTKMPL